MLWLLADMCLCILLFHMNQACLVPSSVDSFLLFVCRRMCNPILGLRSARDYYNKYVGQHSFPAHQIWPEMWLASHHAVWNADWLKANGTQGDIGVFAAKSVSHNTFLLEFANETSTHM